jgi:hypothetical protein
MNSTDWRSLIDASAGPDACWPTTGVINGDGYASMYCQDLHRGIGVARLALAESLGRPIAPRMHALHTCDNRACINPAHLYEGTPADNGRDSSIRNRRGLDPIPASWTNERVVVWTIGGLNRGGYTARLLRERAAKEATA